jgi:Calcineurin-like phosphoesterase
MRFSFIHAADLHIDSPFASLGLKDPTVAARFASAGRKSVERLISETVDSDAAFLIIAGDIFDGDWRDVTTGLFFARALGSLHRADIPTVVIKGNHDADSIMSRSLPYPDSVRFMASDRAETVQLEKIRVAIHGRSFGTRKVSDNFCWKLPRAPSRVAQSRRSAYRALPKSIFAPSREPRRLWRWSLPGPPKGFSLMGAPPEGGRNLYAAQRDSFSGPGASLDNRMDTAERSCKRA